MTKKQFLKKTATKTVNIWLWVVGIVASLGFATLFINGTFMNTFLGVLGLGFHKAVGWTLLILAGIAALLTLFQTLTKAMK